MDHQSEHASLSISQVYKHITNVPISKYLGFEGQSLLKLIDSAVLAKKQSQTIYKWMNIASVIKQQQNKNL